ncbi:MAG: FAD-dependent oxidoreductase [Candidatus Geothermincolia bacterium]
MPILKDRYEVIIIGAGVGGLSAAAVLAHEGLDVLVLERARIPGGCCSSFRVGEFTFDAAASILNGFGKVGYHVQRSLFDFVGQQVDLIGRDSAYTMYFGDSHIEFHRDRHTFTAELGAIFPQQAGSLLSFMRELEDIYHALLDCGGPPRPRSEDSTLQKTGLLARHSLSAVRLAKYARISAEKLLEKHVDDPLAKAFFDADLTFTTGYRLADVTAAQAALAIIDRHIGGTHHAIGSAQRIPDRLEKSIVEGGGRVAYGVSVKSVLAEEGRATGVEIEGGRRIISDVVVANTSARDLMMRLMPPEHARPQTTDWLASLAPSDSVFAIYLGIPEDSLPGEFNPNTVVVDDPEREPHRFISMSVPSLFDPNLSPEGYHSMTIHAAVDPAEWPAVGEPGYQAADYEDKKREQASVVLDRLRPVAPYIGTEPVVWRLAGPATFERYLGRERGAWAASYPSGTLPPASLPGAVTDLRGLFLAGDSTFFGRGVAEAAGSGINAATAAMRYLSLKAPRFVPGRESFVIETVPVRPQISGQAVVDSISAVLESHRCLRCEDAPCMAACPASVDIPNMIRRMSGNDIAGAASLVREVNPLGEVCGIACPASSLCEAACLRKEVDSSVKIGQLEAFVCGVGQGPEGWPVPFKGQRRERVAVIGSGPAGISCAFYLSLMGFNVEIFEDSVEAGGLPAHAMTASRLSRQILEREIEGTMMAGIEFRGNTVFGEDINFESLLREGFRAVFLATGLQSIKMPSVRGTDMPGVIDALSFLGAARRKVKRELAREVAVIGESNLAIDTAVLAHDMGAEKVYLVTGSPIDEIAGMPDRVAAAAEAGVIVVPDRKIIEVVGEGRVEGLRTHANSPGLDTATDEALPGTLDVGTVIIAWEQESDPSLSGYLSAHLKLGESGLVQVDTNMMTSRQGVFAGGDVTSGGALVVRACADGRRAAMGIAAYLDSGSRAQAPQGPSSEGEDGSSQGNTFFDHDVAS